MSIQDRILLLSAERKNARLNREKAEVEWRRLCQIEEDLSSEIANLHRENGEVGKSGW